MATTRGRKTTSKKKEEVVKENPKAETVEKTEDKKVEELKTDSKPESVKEESTPQTSKEKTKKEETLPETKVEVQQEEAVVEKPVLGIGSRVSMPTGRLGTVISINQKGYFEVRSSRNPLKTFLYAKRQLSLVE